MRSRRIPTAGTRGPASWCGAPPAHGSAREPRYRHPLRRGGRPPARPRLARAGLPIALLALTFAIAAVATAPAPAAAAATADAEVAFAFGLAAFHRGDYEEAAERFAAAVEADPDHAEASAWLERARRAAAGEEIAAGPLAAAPPLEEFGDVPPWELDLRASFGNDSNPLRIADGVVAVSPDGTRVFVGPESDTVIGLGVRGALAPVRGRGSRGGGWTLALVGEGYQAIYDEIDFYDFTRLGATAQLAWGGDPSGFLAGPLGYLRVPLGNPRVGLLLQGGLTEDELDGEGYISTTAASASIFLRQGAAGTTRLSATWLDEEFDRDGSGIFEASGTVVEAELAQTFYLGRRERFLRLAAAAGERDAGAAFDASTLGARAELALPFGDGWTLTLAGGLERIDYDAVESNPVFGFLPVDEAREDTDTRLGAALSWAVTPRFLLTGRVSWTDRDADIGPVAEQFTDYDYERTVAAVGFRWSFLGGAR